MRTIIRRQIRIITQNGITVQHFVRFIHRDGQPVQYKTYQVFGVSDRRINALVEEIQAAHGYLASIKKSYNSVEFAFIFPPREIASPPALEDWEKQAGIVANIAAWLLKEE